MNKLFYFFLLIQHDVKSHYEQGRHVKEDDSCWCNEPTSEPLTSFPKQDGTNLSIKNYRQWTNSVFLAKVYSPIHPLTCWYNRMWRKLPTETTFEIHYIFPKLRDWVVVKEDDKILRHKKGVYINTERECL